MDKDGKLNEAQFIVAMYLINSKLRGSEVPDSLPDFLKSELGISTSATSADDKKTMKLKGNYNIDLSDIVTATPASTPTPSLTPAPNANPASTVAPVATPVPGIQPTLSTATLVPNTGVTAPLSVPNSAFLSTTDFSTPPAPLPLPVNSTLLTPPVLTPSTLPSTAPSLTPTLTPTPVVTNSAPNVLPATIGFPAVSPNPVRVEIASNITSLQQKKDDLALQLTDEKNNNQILENDYLQLSAEQDSLTRQFVFLLYLYLFQLG